MDIADRLKEERERLGLSQTAFGQLGGAGKTTVIAWERGSAFPNASFLALLAEHGLDVAYVVTGSRKGPPPLALTAEEQVMLEHFRNASKEVRRAALGALLGAQAGGINQSNSGAGNVQIGNAGGRVSVKGRR